MNPKVFLRIADARVESFIRSELLLMDILPFDGAPDEADYIICDVRAYASLGLHGSHKVAVVLSDDRMREPNGAVTVWRWPMRIFEIREFLRDRDAKVPASTLAGRQTEACEEQLLSLDEEARVACYKGVRIALTDKEVQILRCLREAGGSVVSRDQLAETIGGDDNVLSVHVCHLRQKLEAPFGVRLLGTVRGGGYRLCLKGE